jgi:hypothetical protein
MCGFSAVPNFRMDGDMADIKKQKAMTLCAMEKLCCQALFDADWWASSFGGRPGWDLSMLRKLSRLSGMRPCRTADEARQFIGKTLVLAVFDGGPAYSLCSGVRPWNSPSHMSHDGVTFTIGNGFEASQSMFCRWHTEDGNFVGVSTKGS